MTLTNFTLKLKNWKNINLLEYIAGLRNDTAEYIVYVL